MVKIKNIHNFSYSKYNLILIFKLSEVIIKEFFRFVLFSKDCQKRRFFWERLGFLPPIPEANNGAKWIWIHANAIGEVNASQELIRVTKARYPDKHILLTTSNFTADKRAQELTIADVVLFFPYDIPYIIKKFLKIFKTTGVIIIESDLWPNFVKVCKNNRIPVLVVSGIFSNGHSRSMDKRYLYNYRFRLSKNVFNYIDYFCMQTEEDARGISLEVTAHKNIRAAGNLKFNWMDDDFFMRENLRYQDIFNIKDTDYVFVAGNVHLEESQIVIDAFKKVTEIIPRAIMIIAPRFMEDVSSLEPLLDNAGLSYIRKKDLGTHKRSRENVIILDTMGELAKVYSVAKVAFVGGSLVYLGEVFGGHNILEPAQFGVPIIFGLHMHNFRRLADLFLQKQIAIEVSDAKGLAENIVELMLEDKKRESIKLMSREVFKQNADVAEKTFALLKPFLDTNGSLDGRPDKCEVCAGADFKFLIRQHKYKIFRCKECGLVFSYPIPLQEELDAFYQNFSFNEFEDRYVEESEEIAEYVTSEQLKLLKRLGEDVCGGRFLDIGCGNGYYLHGAKVSGFEVYGVEKDRVAAELAYSRYGVKVFSCDLEKCNFPAGYFDIVKMRQFIEHLPYPDEYLGEVNRILKKGGILIVETVNTQSLETIPRLYFLDAFKKIKTYMPELPLIKKFLLSLRREWGFTDPPRHLYGFSKKNLEALLVKNGFVSLKILTAAMGDKVYYPVSAGHQNFLRENEKEALGRTYKKSKIIYVVYRFMFKPGMQILKLYIKLFGLGSHLIIYARKR